MGALNIVMGILVTIAFVTLCIVIIYYKVKEHKKGEKIEIPDNAPKVRNYWTSKTDGYGEGLEIDVKTGKKERLICSFVPTDIDTTKPREITVKKIVLERGFRIVIPRGELSSKRDLVEYYPNSVTKLPENFSKTEKGKYAMDYISKMSEKNFKEDYLEKGIESKKNLLMQEPLGEISAEKLQLMNSFIEGLLKMEVKEKEREREAKGK